MLKPFNKELLKRRIVEAREKRGLTQAQLAGKAGITPAAISQIENGLRVPTIPVLHKIAAVLEVSLDYLTGKTDEVEIQDLLQQEEPKAFFRGLQSLDPEDRQALLKYYEFLKSKPKDEKKE
jgi:transcriptional regulator with XRE-family HTH domain